MIQFDILTGGKTGVPVVVRRFPFSIGRSPECGLILDDPGVWDRHVEIRRHGLDLKLAAGADALVRVNGTQVEQATLREGDVIELASVKLRFGLSPTRQRRLQVREALTWIALVALSLGQVALIYLLSE